MANIKVPINLKGALKIDTADIQDRLQVDKSARNDLQFLKNIHDTEKFILESNSVTATGTVVIIQPPVGTTFYLLGASVTLDITAGADQCSFSLIKTTSGNTELSQSVLLFEGTGAHNGEFPIKTGSLIGTGITSYSVQFIEGADVTSTADAKLWGYFENSVRP